MHKEDARQAATDTGNRATKLGLMLSDYTDPDTAELIQECTRVAVPIRYLLTGQI